MNISEDAVEAAAQAFSRPYRSWDSLEPEYQEAMRHEARKALNAAAPFLEGNPK